MFEQGQRNQVVRKKLVAVVVKDSGQIVVERRQDLELDLDHRGGSFVGIVVAVEVVAEIAFVVVVVGIVVAIVAVLVWHPKVV